MAVQGSSPGLQVLFFGELEECLVQTIKDVLAVVASQLTLSGCADAEVAVCQLVAQPAGIQLQACACAHMLTTPDVCYALCSGVASMVTQQAFCMRRRCFIGPDLLSCEPSCRPHRS